MTIELPPAAPVPVDPDDSPEDEAGSDERFHIPDLGGVLPDWVILPPGGLKAPPGRLPLALMFKAAWTDTPTKGDRQCIVWSLTDADEKRAYQRIGGKSALSLLEMAKQMIRVTDGVKVNWGAARGAGSIDEFWTDIGHKCRQMVQRVFLKTHSLSEEEQDDFFENCVAAVPLE